MPHLPQLLGSFCSFVGSTSSTTPLQSSSMPLQDSGTDTQGPPPSPQIWLMPHCTPRHMLLTHMPTPPVTAQTWPAEQWTLAQGSDSHMPSTQRSPLMHIDGHKGTQLPLEQYCDESHVTLAQGSS